MKLLAATMYIKIPCKPGNAILTGNRFIPRSLCILLLVYSSGLFAATGNSPKPLTVSYEDGDIELTATCYLAQGDSVVVFLPSVYSPFEDQEKYAREIATSHLSACISHVFTDLFLPVNGGSYGQIPVMPMLKLLSNIGNETGKSIYLVGHGSGNRVAYRIARQSLRNSRPGILSGLIMFSPNLTAEAPEAGEEQQYLDLIYEKTVPLYIFQPSYSPHHWHLDKLVGSIQQSGTKVVFKRIADVRDGYAFREDLSEQEQALRDRAAELLTDAIKQLQHD
jgi:hypothetical protein